MAIQFKMWESGGGKLWYVAYTDSFSKNVENWILPARVLDMPVDKYLEYAMKNFNLKVISAREDGSYVYTGFTSCAEATKFKNFLNKKSRERNFTI